MQETEDPAERLLAEAPVEAAPGNASTVRYLLLEGGSGYLVERLAAGSARPALSNHPADAAHPIDANPPAGRTEIIVHNSDCIHHAAALDRARQGKPATDKAATVRYLLGDLPRAAGSGGPGEDWPELPEYPADSFDAVLYRLGKGTAALHAAVIAAWTLLRPGGSLFLCGHTREGVKSLAKRAEEHFGNAELLALKSSCRLLRFVKSGPSPHRPLPDPLYHAPVPLTIDVPGLGVLPYLSKPGVFAYRATDPGTALLARHLEGVEGRRVLDLCCGSGVLSLAALRLGAREVVAVDSSAAAVAAARRNLAGSPAPARVLCADLADLPAGVDGVDGEFDLILSNPPFHRGAETDYGLPGHVLDASLLRLSPDGRLLLVANQFLDYPAQARGRFSSCETMAQEKGYRVFRLIR